MHAKNLRSFEELECWKACTEVRRFIAGLIKCYPNDEKYALTADMRRAARSATHNIAEGFGRFHFKENIQFCRISRGSLYELTDQLITSLDDDYISRTQYEAAREMIEHAIRLLNGYIRYLNNQKSSRSPLGFPNNH